MNGEAVPSFTSPQQEAEYWRKKAMEYKQSLEETREELEEFQSGSRELEAELEAQLEQTETRCSEYQAQLNRVAMENDSLKERLERLHNEFNGQVNTLQSELADIKSIKEELTRYIRELEQANDDLERAKRATVTSLEDFEARLNLAIERNAFLESELDEKEDLKVTVQRLKDEARDLRQELSIKDNTEPDNDKALMHRHHHHQSSSPQKLHIQPPPKLDVALPPSPAGEAAVDSNKLVSNGTQLSDSVPTTPVVISPPLHNNNNNNMSNGSVPMTPSARISALNIVGDLLRKVGALESRLASCRTLVKDNQRSLGLPAPGNHSAREASRGLGATQVSSPVASGPQRTHPHRDPRGDCGVGTGWWRETERRLHTPNKLPNGGCRAASTHQQRHQQPPPHCSSFLYTNAHPLSITKKEYFF